MQTFGKVREELLHSLADQNAALHLPDHFPQGLGRLFLQLVPTLSLFTVQRNQLLTENLICQRGLHFADALFREVALFWIGAVANHVNMRMVRFIVKCRVPFQMVGMDFQVLRQLHRFGGKQGFPYTGAIIAQPRGVLPAQRNNRRPHIASVGGHFLRHL